MNEQTSYIQAFENTVYGGVDMRLTNYVNERLAAHNNNEQETAKEIMGDVVKPEWVSHKTKGNMLLVTDNGRLHPELSITIKYK